MLKVRKFPSVLLSISTVGVVFAVFAFFSKGKLLFGLVSLAISTIIYLAYLLSYDYKASHLMLTAKKYLDKENADKAADCILESARLNPDEENLVKIFGHQKKNLDAFRQTAVKMYKEIGANDTPFVRFTIASFFYFAGDLKKAKELLNEVPEEKRTIKMVRLLGSTLFDLKDYDKSIEALSTYDPPYLPTNEDELAVVFGLGIAYLSKGDKDKAFEYLVRVETRNSKFGNVSKILASIEDETEKDKSTHTA